MKIACKVIGTCVNRMQIFRRIFFNSFNFYISNYAVIANYTLPAKYPFFNL